MYLVVPDDDMKWTNCMVKPWAACRLQWTPLSGWLNVVSCSWRIAQWKTLGWRFRWELCCCSLLLLLLLLLWSCIQHLLVSGHLFNMILWVVIYSTWSCEWSSIQHDLVSGHLFNIILWVVMYSTSSCEWSCIQHLLVSGHVFNIFLWVGCWRGGGQNNTRGHSLCL